jgi:flavorubredoxin
LQPMTSIVTAINEYGPAVFGTQITIGPNPTSNLLHIKARFNQVGSLSLQLIDAKSSIMFTQDAGTIFSSYDKDIIMENYPSGVFYMKVYFKPITGIAKTGIYKIIKL